MSIYYMKHELSDMLIEITEHEIEASKEQLKIICKLEKHLQKMIKLLIEYPENSNIINQKNIRM